MDGWANRTVRPPAQARAALLTANAVDSQTSEHDTLCALARRTRLVAAVYLTRKRERGKWSTKKGVTAPASAL